MQPRNLAARAGRWSATHRKTAIFGWIAVRRPRHRHRRQASASRTSSSRRGQRRVQARRLIVDDAGFPDDDRRAACSSRARARSSPMILQVTAAVKDVVSRLGEDRGRHGHREPAERGRQRAEHRLQGRPLRGRELHAPGQVRDDGRRAEARAKSPRRRSPPSPRSRRPIPSCASRSTATRRRRRRSAPRSAADEAKSMQFSMGGTLLILLLAFGAAVAAGVPLLLGVSAVRGHHGPARPRQPAQPAA